MARDKEAAQDRELFKMEKLNKSFPKEREGKILTLKEQLALEAKMEKMTPAQRRAAMSWEDWEYGLRDYLNHSKAVVVPDRIYNTMIRKQRADFDKMHADGDTFEKVARWMMEEGEKYMGW